jgi:hypothetical protein
MLSMTSSEQDTGPTAAHGLGWPISESDTNPYVSPRVSEIETKVPGPTPPPRSLPREIIGTVVSMVAGAFLGLMVGGNGLGFVSFVVLCSLMGWVVWIRRKKSFLGTIGICILMVILWWPFGIILRELGRDLL